MIDSPLSVQVCSGQQMAPSPGVAVMMAVALFLTVDGACGSSVDPAPVAQSTNRAAAAPAVATAVATAAVPAAVNPFTGVPLSLEQARWALEQSRLEEQLQASLLNRRKLESERQRLEGSAIPPAAVVTVSRAVPLVRPRRPPAVTLPIHRPADAPADGGAGPATASPLVLGVRQLNGQWCLLVQEMSGLQSVCAGQRIQDQPLQAVTAQGYRLGGVQHALEVGPILLPAARTGAAANPRTNDMPSSGASMQGFTLPAVGTSAEGAPGVPGTLVGVLGDRP